MIGIDTIELEVPLELPEENLIHMESAFYKNRDGSTYKTYSKRLIEDDRRSPRIRYNITTKKLKVTVPSLPYLCHSNSASRVYAKDLEVAITHLDQLTSTCINYELPSCKVWSVNKLDVYADYNVGVDVPAYIRALSTIKPNTYDRTLINFETVRWQNSVRSMQFYDRHSNAIEKQYPAEEVESCKGILRFESSVNQDEILRAPNVISSSFEDVATTTTVEHLLNSSYKKLKIDGGKFLSLKDTHEKVMSHYSKTTADQVISFLLTKGNGFDGPYKRTKTHHINKVLLSLNIVPSLCTKTLDSLSLDSSLRVV